MNLNKINLTKINNDCSYVDEKLNEKWLHVGSGNFHRAHQAYYLHRLLKKKLSNWTIIDFEIINSKRNRQFNNSIKKQDYLYTLLTKNKKIKKFILGSISKFFLNNKKNLIYIKKNIDNNILKLVTITITENGYHTDNGNFAKNNKDIQYDLKNDEFKFKTIYGMLFFILKSCIESKKKITVISCDNIENNSQNLRNSFKIFCNEKNSKFIKHIDKYLIFCNSMVDRITPKYNSKTKKEIVNKFKYNDNCHVESEDYISWIIQRNKKANLPPLEKVGVKFVKNISSYQEMKMKILNASHCSTSFLASLDKKKFVYESFNDKKFIKFINSFISRDVIPYLKKDFYNYKLFLNSVLKRFSNKAVPDLVERTTINGSKNLEIFICSSMKNNLLHKKNIKRFALIFASWYIFINEKKNFEDDNYLYLKKNLIKYRDPVTFIKNITQPPIKYLINDNFKVKFEYYINLIKNKKLKLAINDATK